MRREQLRDLVVGAQPLGAVRVTTTRWEWDVSGDCQSPVVRELHARASPRHRSPMVADKFAAAVKAAFPGAYREIAPARWKEARTITVGPGGQAPPVTLILQVRCRKCDKCRRRRARMWTARALSETRMAARTWFGSMTFTVEEQTRALARARQRLGRQGVDFDALDYGDQFRERVRSLSPLVTLWCKRIRKESNVPLRYILVAEHHESGLPHFHCLVHESAPGRPIRWRTLSEQWIHGFSKFNLVGVDEGSRVARYVCGYISKCAATRVRASAHYGEGPRPNAIARNASVSSVGGLRGGVPPDPQITNTKQSA